MAKARKKDKDVSKWKKKKWYPIIAPEVFNKQFLGETSTFEPSKVVGKAIKVNLMTLTGEVKNQNVNIRLKVTDVKEGQGHAEIVGYTLSPSFIKRIVRRRHSRIDATFNLATKDNKQLVMKPLFITRSRANKSEITRLRNVAMENLKKMAQSRSYDEMIRSMIHYKLQLDMRRSLSKLFPLKTFEIKQMNLVNSVEQ